MSALLEPIVATANPNLLVGFETADDAAVYRLDDTTAIISTADFITPVVDDPRTFGRVAAANSLSDVYAMGGRPLLAINLVGYPEKDLAPAVLAEILAGAADICSELDCPVAGGHTVRDSEVKFGLAVTGVVHPDRVLRNCTARAGDALVLTKPLGTGALVAASKAGKLAPAGYEALIACMTAPNDAGTVLFEAGATAVTDVTGFGLTGHGLEMARGSDLQLVIDTTALPVLPAAVELCGAGFTCGGTKVNAAFTDASIEFAPTLGNDLRGLLHDPQTSGGLLVAVPADRCDSLIATVLDAGVLCARRIGECVPRPAAGPYLRFF